MQTTTPRARLWRVTLSHTETVEITAIKLVITDSGALMFLGRDREPVRVIRDWSDCRELRSADR